MAYGARTWAKPRRRAAPFPWFTLCSKTCIRGSRASFWGTSRVRSVEPSSTTISSAVNGDASTRSTIGSIVARSLKHGITTARHRSGTDVIALRGHAAVDDELRAVAVRAVIGGEVEGEAGNLDGFGFASRRNALHHRRHDAE